MLKYLYYILRPLARYALKLFFRKIYFDGFEHLKDKDSALIFACNHPNGFLEPIVLACFMDFPVYFLVRGDLFRNKWLKPIMIGTNQIPIYRFRDGFTALKNNLGTMQESLRIISEKKALLIYPEGTTIQTIYLRPIKKGAARLAIQAKMLNPELPIKLVPVGVNYSDPNAFRSDVKVKIGVPIPVELEADSEESVNLKIMELTRELDQRMKALVKQVAPENEEYAKSLLRIKSGFDRHYVLPIKENNGTSLESDLDLIRAYKTVPDKSEIHGKIDNVIKRLDSQGMDTPVKIKNPFYIIPRIILLAIGFPIFAMAFLVHLVPIGLIIYITRRFVKEQEFTTSVLAMGSAAAVNIWYLMLLPFLIWIGFKWIFLLVLFALSLFFAAHYLDLHFALWQQLKIRTMGKKEYRQLRFDAQEIMERCKS